MASEVSVPRRVLVAGASFTRVQRVVNAVERFRDFWVTVDTFLSVCLLLRRSSCCWLC